MSRRRERFVRAAAVSLLALASLLTAMTPAHAQEDPVVSIAGTSRQTEGADLMFTLTLSPAPPSELTVDVTVSESGSVLAPGAPPTQVTVAANTSTATLTVATNDDNVYEGTGTPRIAGSVTATVDTGTGYTVHDAAKSASIDVQDDEVLNWSVVADPITIAEAGGTSDVTVSTGGPEFAAPWTINLVPSTMAPRGTPDVDYTVASGGSTISLISGTYSLTLAAGETSLAATLTAVDDEEVEMDEPAFFIFNRLLGVSITITDDESTNLALTVAPDTVAEGDGATALTVTGMLNGKARATDTVVALTVSPGTAAAADYAAGTAMLTIAGGATSGTATLTLTPVDDTNDEPDETVTVGGMVPVDGLVVGMATVTITDNDERVAVNPAVLPAMAEGSAATYTVNLTGDPPTAPVTVDVTGHTGENLTVTPSSLTFTADDFSAAQTVTVRAGTDDIIEADQSVTLTNTASGSSYESGEVQVTVTDATSPAVVSVSFRDKSPNPTLPYAIGEPILVDVTFNGSMNVTDTTGTPAIELVVGSSSKSAPYFEGSGSDVLTFRYEVEVDVEDTDGVSIGANKLSLNGSTISTAVTSVPLSTGDLTHSMVAGTNAHRVDGVRPTVTAASVNGSALTLTWSEDLNGSSTPPGSAFALTLGSGETAPTVSTVAVSGNTITLTLSAAVGASISATLDYTPGTPPIEDLPGNDAETFDGQAVTNEAQNVAPMFASTTVTTREVPESATVGTVIGVALTATDTDNDDLTYTLGGPDQEFFQLNSSTELVLTVVLDFEAPGSADGDNGYEVTVTANDGTADAVISVTVNVTDVPDVVPGKPANLVAGADDPNAVNLTWDPADRGDSDITGYRIEESSDGNDWTELTASTGSAGTTYEHTGRTPNTTYHYRVSAINTAGAGPASDPASTTTPLHVVSVMAVAASVTEGSDTRVAFTLTRDGTPTTPLTVQVVARTSGDFTALSFSAVDRGIDPDQVRYESIVEFGASENTATFADTIIDDNVVEAEGRVQLTVTPDASYTVSGTAASATVTTLDDDEPNFSLSASPPQVVEGAGTELTVDTGGVSFTEAQTISLAFAGTAAEADYTVTDVDGAALSGELTLAVGATSVTATITATDDQFVEDAETIEITGGHAAATFSTTVTIPANDPPTFRLVVSPDATIEEDDDDTTPEDERIATVHVEVEGATFETAHEIRLSPGGSATLADDYTMSTQTLTFAGRATASGTATIRAVSDNVSETEETIEFSHGGTTFPTTVAIPANDPPDYTPVVSPETITEGESATVSVETGGVTFATPQEITISLSSGDGAREDVDYTVSTTTLTIAVGQTASDAATITAVNNRVAEDDENLTITFAGGIGTRNLRITDNDVPSFSADSEEQAIKEGGGTNRPESGLFEVTTNVPFEQDQTLTLQFTDELNTATPGVDYTVTGDGVGATALQGVYELRLPAGATSVTFTVTAADDAVIERLDEFISLEGYHEPGNSDFRNNFGDGLELRDDDLISARDVGLILSSSPTTPGEGTSATVTLNSPSPTGSPQLTFEADQTVTLTFAGTAAAGADYTVMGAAPSGDGYAVTLPAGAVSVAFTIAVSDDALMENSETIEISAADFLHHEQTLETAAVTVTIPENDQPTYALRVSPDAIGEGGVATVTVETGGVELPSDAVFTLTLGGTATQGGDADYTVSSESLTLTAGQMSVTATITTLDDTLMEGDETILIDARLGMQLIGTQTITIEANDDPMFMLSLDVDRREEGETALLTVDTGGVTFAADQTISLTFGGTAMPADYTVNGTELSAARYELTLPMGDMVVTATIAVRDDAVVELEEETIVIDALHDGAPAGMQQTVTIEPSGQTVFTLTTSPPDSPAVIREADDTATSADERIATLTVMGTGGITFATSQTISFVFADPAAGTAAVPDDDYTVTGDGLEGSAPTYMLTLPPGSESVTLTIAAREDSLVEGNEAVRVTAQHENTTISARDIVIEDDDAPVFALSVSSSTIEEGAAGATVTASITNGVTFAAEQAFTLMVDSADGDATESDYAVTQLAMAAEAVSGTALFEALPDDVVEGEETFTIRFTYGTAEYSATVTIPANDPPAWTLAAEPETITEGATTTLTVSTGGVMFAAAQTIGLTVTGASAGDYRVDDGGGTELSAPYEITLPAGDTDVTATVTAVNDNVVEGAETLTIAAVHDGTEFAAQTVTVPANDPPAWELSAEPDAISEGAATTLTVSTGGVRFTTAQTIALTFGGDATVDDYTVDGISLSAPAPSHTLTLPAGQTSLTATLAPVSDRVVEGDETLTIAASHGGTEFATQTLTIAASDAPAFAVSASPPTIGEGESTTLRVEIDNNVTFATDQTIDLELTGAADADYTVVDSGGVVLQAPYALTLAAGQTSVEAVITALDDNVVEADETVTVTASRDATTVIGSADFTISGSGVTAFALSVLPNEIVEGESATVTVASADGATFGEDQTITLELGGSAAADDYTVADSEGTPLQAPYALTLAVGQASVEVTVTAVDDSVVEGAEAIEITAVHEATNIGTRNILIAASDGLTLALAVSGDEVAEGESVTVTATVTNDVQFEEDQVITLTLGGSAREGDDYTLTPASLTIAAGQTSATATLTALADGVAEGDETIEITASHDETAIGSATVTIPAGEGPAFALSVSLETIVGEPVPAAEIAEGQSATVTVDTGGATFEEDQIIVLALAGSAAADDYTLTPASLTLAAGQTSVTATLTALADGVAEAAETIMITASHDGMEIGSTTVTILSSDRAATEPAWSVSVSPGEIAEGESATVTVDTGGATFEEDQTIVLAPGGSAVADDYTLTPASLTLAAGQTSVTATITALADGVAEGAETITLTAMHQGMTIGSGQIRISGDDEPANTAPVFAEGAEAAREVEENTPADMAIGDPVTAADADPGDTLTYSLVGAAAGTFAVEASTGQLRTSGPLDHENRASYQVNLAASDGRASATILVTVRVSDANEPPGAPSAPVAEPGGGPEGVVVSWTAPSVAGIPAIDDYDVEYRLAGSTEVTAVEHHGAATRATLVGLDPDGLYEVRVRATNAEGSGPWSEAGTVGAPPNRPPEVVATAPMQTLEIGGGAARVDPASYFRDPDGDPLTYAAVSSNAEVAEAEWIDGRVVITPVGEGEAVITVTATDAGGLSARLMIRVRIEPAREIRMDRAVGSVLPEETRARVDSVVEAVAGRIKARREERPSGAAAKRAFRLGGSSGLDELMWRGRALAQGSADLKRMLGDSSFLLPLNASGEPAGPFRDLTIWGSGDYRSMDGGSDSGVDWNGEMLSTHVGADVRYRRDVLAGMAVSWSRGSFDYSDGSGDDRASGTYESRLGSISPYVSWTGPWGMGLWATAGLGIGDVELEGEGGETEASDLDQRSVAAGLDGVVFSSEEAFPGGEATLRLRGEGLLAQAEVEASGRIAALTTRVSRLRVALEGDYSSSLASGGVLAPSVELGWRYDGGDGETGNGFELGGSLRYRDPAMGVTLEAGGRTLLAAKRDYREWGVRGLLVVDPGLQGQGWWLRVKPEWGRTAGGVASLWEQGLVEAPTAGSEAQGRIETRLGYGVSAFGGRLSTYGGFSGKGGGSRRYVVGSRLEAKSGLDLRLEFEVREPIDEKPGYGVMLQGALRF